MVFTPARWLLCSAVCAGAALAADPKPATFHSLVRVNDTRSHGQVGDNFLSLNEAIQLHNGTLTYSQLSQLEQFQCSIDPFSGDYAFARVMAGVVPTITCERDFDPILPSQYGFSIYAFGGKTTIDLQNTVGLQVTNNSFDMRGFVMRGGTGNAITITRNDGGLGSGVWFNEMEFEGQPLAAVRIALSQPGETNYWTFDTCQFRNLPTAIQIDDLGASRSGSAAVYDTTFRQVGIALDVTTGDNGLMTWILDRVTADASQYGVRFRHNAPGAGAQVRGLSLDSTHLNLAGGIAALQCDGDAQVVTSLRLRSATLAGTGTGRALVLGPDTSGFDVVLEDSRLTGSVQAGATAGAGVVLRNDLFTGGLLTLTSQGAPLAVRDSLLYAASVWSAGGTSASVQDSCLMGGSALGQAAAPLRIDRSFVATTALLGNVVANGSLALPQLGAFDLTPLEPPIGTNLDLQVDLPTGLTGILLFGPTAPYPTLGTPPMHFYLNLALLTIVPIALRGNLRAPLPIPLDPALRNLDLYFQLPVVPDPGRPAPALAMPPGRRIILR